MAKYVNFDHSSNHGFQVGFNEGTINIYNRAEDIIDDHPHARENRLDGTCIWLLDREEYKTWIGQPKSSVLWIHGRIGSGKTKIMQVLHIVYPTFAMLFFSSGFVEPAGLTSHVYRSRVIDELKSQSKSPPLLLYFYIDRTKEQLHLPRTIFQTLLKQLLRQDKQELDKFDDSIRGIIDGNTREITDALSKLFLQLRSPVFIVLDALNECSVNNRRMVIENLDNFLQMARSTGNEEGFPIIKILISSRDQDGVRRLEHRECLNTIEAPAIEVRTIEVLPEDNASDIRRLFREKWPDENSEILQRATDAVGGMFLIAKILCENTFSDTLLKFLERPSSLSRLQEFYDEVIKKIRNQPGQEDRAIAHTALMIVKCARGRIQARDLLMALAITTNLDKPCVNQKIYARLEASPEKIATFSGNLIEFNKDRDVFYFVHSSVHDYFQNAQSELDNPGLVAEICISYLRFEKFDSGPLQDVSWFHRGPLDNYLKEHSLLLFASCHWGDQSRLGMNTSGKSKEELKTHLLKFWEMENNMLLAFQVFLFSLGKTLPEGVRRTHIVSYFALDELVDIQCLGSLELKSRDQKGRTALHWALQRKDGEISNLVVKLISSGIKVNSTDKDGHTPLYYASKNGQADTVRTLLKKRAKVDARAVASGRKTATALIIASRGAHYKTVKALLEHGAAVNIESEHATALQAAAWGGSLPCVAMLLEKKPKLHSEAGVLGPALHEAAFWGYDQIVKELLDRGFDATLMSTKYGSAVQAAAAGCLQLVDEEPYIKILGMLIKSKVDVNIQGGFLEPAIIEAAGNGREGIVEYLIEHKADPNIQGLEGTAYQVAHASGHTEVESVLRRHDVDITPRASPVLDIYRVHNSVSDPNEPSVAPYISLLKRIATPPLQVFTSAAMAKNGKRVEFLVSKTEQKYRVAIDMQNRDAIGRLAFVSEEVFKSVIPRPPKTKSQKKADHPIESFSTLRKLTRLAIAIFDTTVARFRSEEAQRIRKRRSGSSKATTPNHSLGIINRLTAAAVTIMSHAIDSKNQEIIDLISNAWIVALQNVIAQPEFGPGLMKTLVQNRAKELREHFHKGDIPAATQLANVGVELLASSVAMGETYRPLSQSLSGLWSGALTDLGESGGGSRPEDVDTLLRIFMAKFDLALENKDKMKVTRFAQVAVEVMMETVSQQNAWLIDKMAKVLAEKWKEAIAKGMDDVIQSIVDGRTHEFGSYIREDNTDEASKLSGTAVGIFRAGFNHGAEEVSERLAELMVTIMQSALDNGRERFIMRLVDGYKRDFITSALRACTGKQDTEVGNLFIAAASLMLTAKRKQFYTSAKILSKAGVEVIEIVSREKNDFLTKTFAKWVDGYAENIDLQPKLELIFGGIVRVLHSLLTDHRVVFESSSELISIGASLLKTVERVALAEGDEHVVRYLEKIRKKHDEPLDVKSK